MRVFAARKHGQVAMFTFWDRWPARIWCWLTDHDWYVFVPKKDSTGFSAHFMCCYRCGYSEDIHG